MSRRSDTKWFSRLKKKECLFDRYLQHDPLGIERQREDFRE
jgi:hypothetical protein